MKCCQMSTTCHIGLMISESKIKSSAGRAGKTLDCHSIERRFKSWCGLFGFKVRSHLISPTLCAMHTRYDVTVKDLISLRERGIPYSYKTKGNILATLNFTDARQSDQRTTITHRVYNTWIKYNKIIMCNRPHEYIFLSSKAHNPIAERERRERER